MVVVSFEAPRAARAAASAACSEVVVGSTSMVSAFAVCVDNTTTNNAVNADELMITRLRATGP